MIQTIKHHTIQHCIIYQTIFYHTISYYGPISYNTISYHDTIKYYIAGGIVFKKQLVTVHIMQCNRNGNHINKFR